jgi:hypothetical protein
MSRITVLGGTGYAGGNIVREAQARGHEVTSFSRSEPKEPLDGVTYRTGSALDLAAVTDAVAGADVVVVAVAPYQELETSFASSVLAIAELVRTEGARLGVVGGSGTLLDSPDGPRVYETPAFPKEYAAGSRVHEELLDGLRATDASLDWFELTPALEFGSYAPGTATGTFRLGDDVVVKNDQGRSQISGADFAQAFVDEIENPAHPRARFTVAY